MSGFARGRSSASSSSQRIISELGERDHELDNVVGRPLYSPKAIFLWHLSAPDGKTPRRGGSEPVRQLQTRGGESIKIDLKLKLDVIIQGTKIK